MFASKFVGKKKQIEVATKKIDAMLPLRRDHLPRLKGPCLKVWRETVTLRMMGIA
jgi:hypothetical protein